MEAFGGFESITSGNFLYAGAVLGFMKCLILAAGYATRLYPLTKDRPKPLLEVAGKPMMDWIMEKVDPLREVDHVYVVTNDKFVGHFQAYADRAEYDTPITVLSDGTKSEEDRLGAVGDIAFSIANLKIDDDLMIIAGDNLFEFDLSSLVARFHKNNGHVIAARDLGDRELAKRFGILAVDKDSRVIDFEEKPQEPKSTLASTLTYIFPKAKLPLVSRFLKECGAKDRAGDYLAWLYQSERLDALVFDEPWFDIGSFDQLEEANRFYKDKMTNAVPKVITPKHGMVLDKK